MKKFFTTVFLLITLTISAQTILTNVSMTDLNGSFQSINFDSFDDNIVPLYYEPLYTHQPSSNIILTNEDNCTDKKESSKEINKSYDDYKFSFFQLLLNGYLVLISILATFLVARLNGSLKKLEIKTQTRNMIVKERLKHYPKLHIQTDKMGEAIRYYNIQPSKNKLKKLKIKLEDFHKELADWDAKYCIYAGKNVTNNIGKMRKRLETREWTVDDLTQMEGDKTIYKYLLNIEDALKEEMSIFYADEKEKKKGFLNLLI